MPISRSRKPSGAKRDHRGAHETPTGPRRRAAAGRLHRDRPRQTTGDYEEDHLIPLELGGAPADPRNLWPEPYASKHGARVKDRLENALHRAVCAGQIGLRAAQRAIARNWWAAYSKYVPHLTGDPM